MKIKYTIDRNSLYNGEYDNAKKIIRGNKNDKISSKSHLAVIYRIAKIMRRRKQNWRETANN